MITATLTTKRRIAAAHAAWIAAGAIGTVDEYVQRMLDGTADSWVESTKVDEISVGDFILRFSGPEYSDITSSTDPNIVGILATMRARKTVRLGSDDAINGVAYLVGAGKLTPVRGEAVLHYEIPQPE